MAIYKPDKKSINNGLLPQNWEMKTKKKLVGTKQRERHQKVILSLSFDDKGHLQFSKSAFL